jgi:hypothetical protein
MNVLVERLSPTIQRKLMKTKGQILYTVMDFTLRTLLSALMALLFILLAVKAAESRHPETFVSVELSVPAYKGVQHSFADIEDMARNIYYESRGQPDLGQVAVAHVVLNRLRAGVFANTVHGVIYQRLPVCQFSWVCQPRYPIHDQVAWTKAMVIAQNVLEGNIADPTSGSLYFHVTTLGLSSQDDKIICIKDHVFYNKKPIVYAKDNNRTTPTRRI